jgi:hypothetical protein
MAPFFPGGHSSTWTWGKETFGARRFYERNGFRLAGRKRQRERDGKAELQMERQVNRSEHK